MSSAETYKILSTRKLTLQKKGSFTHTSDEKVSLILEVLIFNYEIFFYKTQKVKQKFPENISLRKWFLILCCTSDNQFYINIFFI